MSRLQRLAGTLEEPFLVTHGTNVRYLTSFQSSNCAALVEPDRTTLYADFRYAEAGRSVQGVAFVETARDLLADLAGRLAGRRIAFEADSVSYSGYQTLAAGGLDLVATHGVVERLRRVKEPAELEAIRRAAELSDRMYESLARERFTGRTERELGWWIDQRFHDLGADAPAFATIVASGPNGARPHAGQTDRVIEMGTLVTVDAGCVVGGYCSDCTRTFATGELPRELADAYELCLRAQLAGLEALRPGNGWRDADAASRAVIEAAGHGEHFGHGLGHGVGLEVHEAPFLRPEAAAGEALEAGNVVTVEPGIYLPPVGGVRIEDLVLVTPDGGERLTRFTKELVTVE